MRILFYIILLVPVLGFAQLTTSGAMSPPSLVQNVLLGTGVQVSNINYTGDIQAIGSFNFNGANLGLTQGVVLTTGTIHNTGNGPQGPNNQGGSGIDNSGGPSGILNTLVSPLSTFNAAILEFDLQAQGDSVSFRYIFGSEEYPEYVNSDFNDVFGLFISGPGIVGTQNIAKLPNQTVVSINNVNNGSSNTGPCVNCANYVFNGDGSQAPFNNSSQFIQYDGYTRVLTAASAVQCGQTYHLIIAIADAGDGILDSGIFLEAQSLSSNVAFEADFNLSSTIFADPSMMAEGCVSSEITLNRFDASETVTINVLTAGSATESVDYEAIPNQITFPAGQSSFSFDFDVFSDGITEPIEDLYLIFMFPNECGILIPDTLSLKIQSVEPVSIELLNDTIPCGPGGTVNLVPVVSGGLEPLEYLWSTGETTPSIDVTLQATEIVSVRVMDLCLNLFEIDSAEIFVPNIPPLVIAPITDIVNLCPYQATDVVASVVGGSGGYTFEWSLNSLLIDSDASLNISPENTQTYMLEVTDVCGLNATIQFDIVVTTLLLIPSINQPILICPGDSVLLSASASLGLGNYVYTWLHTEETSSDVWVNPLQTTSYTVNISDECQTYSVPISTSVPVREPLASFSYNSSSLEVNSEIQFYNTNPNSVSFSWDLGNGETSDIENPSTSYSEINEYLVTLIAVDDAGCIDTTSKIISIGSVLYIPNTFTPDGNRYNNEFFAESFNIQIIKFEIFNRWGELIFESYSDNRFRWDGTYKGKPCQDGVYSYKIRYKKPNSDELIKTGHVNLLR